MSNHIQLFQGVKNAKESDHRLDLVRPEKLNFSQINNTTDKWIQCKILGKNISIRSYAAACSYNSQLYVYGGFQILNGILSDFHKINLDATQEKFEWKEIQVQNSNSPGPRARHALLNFQNKIYLIGGISSTSDIRNDVWVFDLQNATWQELKPKGIQIPHLQSFGSTIVQDRIIIMCGYNGVTCQFSNSVYEYNILTNTWTALYMFDETIKNQPSRRSGSAIASDGKSNIYLFGGKEEQNRLNDLWVFSLESKKYTRVEDKPELRPFVRNGHSMNYNEGRLYIFGGIHEVTWELDDLHIFNLKTNDWTTLQVDSARRKEQKTIDQIKKTVEKQSPPPKSPRSPFSQKKNSPAIHFKMQQSLDLLHSPNSPGKMIDQQRKKAFNLRKIEMLKPFQISEQEKLEFINVEPTSQAMKNSLDIIGNPNPKVKVMYSDKLTEFGKTSCSKFLQPLSNNSNLIPGKKPCARDGHNSIQIKNDLIIFGGDRHQMSFNDIFKLNINVVKNILLER